MDLNSFGECGNTEDTQASVTSLVVLIIVRLLLLICHLQSQLDEKGH